MAAFKVITEVVRRSRPYCGDFLEIALFVFAINDSGSKTGVG
jgi:hypothetical protein